MKGVKGVKGVEEEEEEEPEPHRVQSGQFINVSLALPVCVCVSFSPSLT